MKIDKIRGLIVLVIIFFIGLFFGFRINKDTSNNFPFNLNIFAKSCEYNGNTYKSGEGFSDIDLCNTCSCDNGKVVCTTMACEPRREYEEVPINPDSSMKSCFYNGVTYQSGEGFADIDGCNSCSCEDGKVACTLMACE